MHGKRVVAVLDSRMRVYSKKKQKKTESGLQWDASVIEEGKQPDDVAITYLGTNTYKKHPPQSHQLPSNHLAPLQNHPPPTGTQPRLSVVFGVCGGAAAAEM